MSPDDTPQFRIWDAIRDRREELVRAFQFGNLPATPVSATGTAQPVGVPTGAAQGANAVVVADPTYYTVRIRLLGFYCATETWDHVIEVDGARDEIFVRADVQQLDANMQPVGTTARETPVYGATPPLGLGPSDFDNRLQAGTATAYGGIRSGDSVPGDIRRVASRPETFADRLPMLLWEHNGTVGDQLDGFLLITPTIIEWDGSEDFLTQFGTDIANFLKGFGEVTAAGSGGLAAVIAATGATAPPVALVIAGVGAALLAAPKLIAELQKFLGSAGDRPIGQKLVDGKRTFDPLILTFNLAKIRDAADSNPLSLGRGIWGVAYEDSDNLGTGKYGAYVQVEHYVWPVLQ